jgi:hypothetical protein
MQTWGKLLWPVAAGGLAVGAGALAASAMSIPMAAAGATAVLLTGLLRPKLLVLLTLLTILFVDTLQTATGMDVLSYLDEAAVLGCVILLPFARLMAGQTLRWLPETGWILGFLVAGVISGIVLQVDWAVLGEGAFLAVKGALLAWAVGQLDWTERDFASIVRVVGVVLALTVVSGAVNLVIPELWTAAVQSGGDVEYRYGLPSLVGPFSHPSAFGQIAALGAIAVVAYRATIARSLTSAVLLIGSLFAVVFSLRRRLVVGVLASIGFVRLKVARATTALVALIALPPALIVLWPLLTTATTEIYQDYLTGEPAARTVITVDSFDVAAEYFPLGAGFGRFGSFIAGDEYSPEYVARGYPLIYGLGNTPERGNQWLTDTQWPAIIGESGFIGAACYVAALAVMYWRFRTAWRVESTPWLRCVGLTGMGWTVMMLIDSVASPVFNAAPTFPLLFTLAAILRSGLASPAVSGDRRAGAAGSVGGESHPAMSPPPRM